MFAAQQVATQLIHSLSVPIRRIEANDGDLAKQLRRAAASVLFNIVEGNRRLKRDRQHLFRIAAGSAAEVGAALEVARAWGYISETNAVEALALVDRELGLLWGLTKRPV